MEKRNFASLRYTKEATGWAEKLLVVDPTCYDARLAIGVSRYHDRFNVGARSVGVKDWVACSGDKEAGIADLQITAQKGRYLAPFARILLAIAFVREHERARSARFACIIQQEFPNNPCLLEKSHVSIPRGNLLQYYFAIS